MTSVQIHSDNFGVVRSPEGISNRPAQEIALPAGGGTGL